MKDLKIVVTSYKRATPDDRVVRFEEFDTEEAMHARYKVLHEKFWEDFNKKDAKLALPSLYPILKLPEEDV